MLPASLGFAVRESRVRADGQLVLMGHSDSVPHQCCIARMGSAGDIDRGDVGHEVCFHIELLGRDGFAEVAIQIDAACLCHA